MQISSDSLAFRVIAISSESQPNAAASLRSMPPSRSEARPAIAVALPADLKKLRRVNMNHLPEWIRLPARLKSAEFRFAYVRGKGPRSRFPSVLPRSAKSLSVLFLGL